jgi:hypothetical protein
MLLGAIGYPASIAARLGLGGGAIPADTLLLVALSAQNAACAALAVGTWRTFRPQASMAGALVALQAAAFAASLFAPIFGLAGGHDVGPFYYLGFAGRAGAFAWAFLESARYSAQMKRRLELGLAQPIVVNRFQLWTACTGAVTFAFAVFLAGRLLTENVAQAPWVLGVTSITSVIGGLSLWLAFLPPAWYLRRFISDASA